MTWYGQKETDKYIAEYFPNQNEGFCIEVGCSDGVRGSNTKYFEDLGWNVICIDPIEKHCQEARKTRKLVLNCACGKNYHPKYETFTTYYIGKDNINSSLSSLNTDKRLLETHGNLINKTETHTVITKSLQSIIDRFGNPKTDFISIDTEGTELDVLYGIDFYRTRPKLLVVENNFEDKNIREYLSGKGYRFDQRYFVNDFFIREKDEIKSQR